MILQHHERFSGNGYPLGINGSKLKPESQILGIADEFDELTRLESGHQNLSPEDAIDKIRSQASFDPEIISKLTKMFSTKGIAA